MATAPSKSRGQAVIISNANFVKNTGYGLREGAKVDKDKMTELFTGLGFRVTDYMDQTAEDMKKTLQNVAEKETNQEDDCFVCVISSHGEQKVESSVKDSIRYHEHEIAGVDGKFVKTAELIEYFKDNKCKSLKGKPKLFFIQACRSEVMDNDDERWDKGVEVQVQVQYQKKGQSGDIIDAKASTDDQEKREKADSKEMIDIISVPCFNNMLVMFASPAGKFAMRNNVTGSWMLSEMYDYIKKKGFKLDDDFLSVLVEISRIIAENREYTPKDDKKREGSKTVPCITHMLQNDVYFN